MQTRQSLWLQDPARFLLRALGSPWKVLHRRHLKYCPDSNAEKADLGTTGGNYETIAVSGSGDTKEVRWPGANCGLEGAKRHLAQAWELGKESLANYVNQEIFFPEPLFSPNYVPSRIDLCQSKKKSTQRTFRTGSQFQTWGLIRISQSRLEIGTIWDICSKFGFPGPGIGYVIWILWEWPEGHRLGSSQVVPLPRKPGPSGAGYGESPHSHCRGQPITQEVRRYRLHWRSCLEGLSRSHHL